MCKSGNFPRPRCMCNTAEHRSREHMSSRVLITRTHRLHSVLTQLPPPTGHGADMVQEEHVSVWRGLLPDSITQ